MSEIDGIELCPGTVRALVDIADRAADRILRDRVIPVREGAWKIRRGGKLLPTVWPTEAAARSAYEALQGADAPRGLSC